MDQTKRRRRPALSCLECRRRKIKCDRKDPCTHCTSVRIQCTFRTYDDEPISRQQSQQYIQSGPSVIMPVSGLAEGHGNQPLASITSSLHQTQHNSTNGSTTGREAHLSPATLASDCLQVKNRTQEIESDIRNLSQRVQRLEDYSSPSRRRTPSRNSPDRCEPPTPREWEAVLDKSRSLGRSQPFQMPPEFEPIIECYTEAIGHGKGTSFQGPEARALVVQMGDLLKECKTIARSMKMARPSRSLSSPGVRLEPPSREIADAAVKSYFTSFESIYRILHQPTFLSEYQRYWSHPETVPTSTRLQVLLMIAIGLSLYPGLETETGFRYTICDWIFAAQTWLSGPLEKDRLNIAAIQIHCLTILARQLFSVGGDLIWVSAGSLIHQAMQVGLHRDPKYLPKTSILQAELRKRLWATVLEITVQSSLDAGMPPRISFDEFDTAPPSNNDDDEIDESTTSLQPHPKTTYTNTSIQLLLLDSLPPRLRMLQQLYGFHSKRSYPDILKLDSEITDAYRTCRRILKDTTGSGATPFHCNLVDFSIRRFLLCLHLPFATDARTHPLFYFSRKVCLDTSIAIMCPEPDVDFARLLVTGGGMFRSAVRYASAIIFLDLIGLVETQRLEETLHRPSQQVEMLKQTARGVLEQSLERIRQGETNVKNHMFQLMMMAEVEAIERGTEREVGIARAAVESLTLCRGILGAQVDAVSAMYPASNGISSGFDDGSYDFGLDLGWDPLSPNLEMF